MADVDQQLRQGSIADFKSNIAKILAADQSHKSRLREIFKEHGFLGLNQVGGAAVRGEFLIAQHSTDLEFHQLVLAMMVERLEAEGDVPRDYIATMMDRVQILKKEPQIFGTQRDEKGVRIPSFTADAAQIDRLRRSMGVVPMAYEDCMVSGRL